MQARIVILCVIAVFARVASADDRAIAGIAKGSVAVEMDREEWSADEPITGKLVFEVSGVRDKTGRALDAVRLHEPRIDIAFPDDMVLVLPQVKWRSVFFPTIKVGRRYEMPFVIRVDEGFAKLLKKDDADFVLFKPGRYKLSATIDSPTRPVWDDPPQSIFAELHQQFNSKEVEVTIKPARTGGGGGGKVGGDDVKRALAEAEGPLKHRIVTFYAKRKLLSKEDLLAAIDAATGKPKAELAALHLSLNYPPADLKFFTAVSAPIKLTGHGAAPLYILARPQQRVRFDFNLSELHRLRVANLDTAVTTTTQVDLDAPRAEGVYEMFDDAHKKPWGWLLVYADDERIAAAGLRPDTRELSAKVAEALFKQDAKALTPLAAPGFRVEETMKKLRFQLADGDIRYHESTGTSNKVKTRMKVNVAPQGKDAVFARELWLEFVRVGEELKLTNAAVWDVEK